MEQTKLYVGNLPWQIDEATLRDIFGAFGDIKNISLIVNRNTGQSRGFAFISFFNETDATSAIEVNGKEIDGRKLVVNFAVDKQRRRGNRLWRR